MLIRQHRNSPDNIVNVPSVGVVSALVAMALQNAALQPNEKDAREEKEHFKAVINAFLYYR